MARKSITERIASQAEKIARDQARLDLMRGLEKKAAKKRDDRRKILIGAAVIGEIERDPVFRQRVMQLLHVALVRPVDREVLCDLLPEGSHPHAANSDRAPVEDERSALLSAASEVTRSPGDAAPVLAQLDQLIGDAASPENTPRLMADG